MTAPPTPPPTPAPSPDRGVETVTYDYGHLPFIVDIIAAVGQLAIGAAALGVTVFVFLHERARAARAEAEAQRDDRRQFIQNFEPVREAAKRMRQVPEDERLAILAPTMIKLNRIAVSYDDGRDALVGLWNDYAYELAKIEKKRTGALTVEVEWVNQSWVRGHDTAGTDRSLETLLKRVMDDEWLANAQKRGVFGDSPPS